MKLEPDIKELSKQMAEFAIFLRDNPESALEFLKAASILNEEGRLRKHFGGDAE